MTRNDVLLWIMFAALGAGIALLLTACAKPPPVSAPLATPTAVNFDKGIIGPEAGPLEGYLRSQPALAWPKPRVARLAMAGSQEWGLAGDGSAMEAHRSYKSEVAGSSPAHPTEYEEIPWRGLVVLPDLSVVYLDPEMAATQASVSLQESTWRCDAYRTTEVAGVSYEVLGLFQLLYDAPIQRLTERMGYTKEDLLRCQPNALVAQEWRRLTDKEVEWRLWVARPQYRTDKSVSGEW